MQINTEFNGLQPNGAPIPAPPPKRAAATPLRDGDQAQEDRRHNQDSGASSQDGRPVFRSLFTEATQAGLNATANDSFKSTEQSVENKSEFIRPEKRPEYGPVSLSDSDTNGLFAYIAAARQTAESNAGVSTPPQDFITATTRYTEQAFAAANVFAGRGETLELQA